MKGKRIVVIRDLILNEQILKKGEKGTIVYYDDLIHGSFVRMDDKHYKTPNPISKELFEQLLPTLSFEEFDGCFPLFVNEYVDEQHYSSEEFKLGDRIVCLNYPNVISPGCDQIEVGDVGTVVRIEDCSRLWVKFDNKKTGENRNKITDEYEKEFSLKQGSMRNAYAIYSNQIKKVDEKEDNV